MKIIVEFSNIEEADSFALEWVQRTHPVSPLEPEEDMTLAGVASEDVKTDEKPTEEKKAWEEPSQIGTKDDIRMMIVNLNQRFPDKVREPLIEIAKKHGFAKAGGLPTAEESEVPKILHDLQELEKELSK